MKKMKIFLLIFSIFVSQYLASESGSAGMQILKFSPSARISGLADSSASLLHEVDNLFYNPAGAYSTESFEGSTGYAKGYQEINYFYFAGKMNIKNIGNIGIGFVNVMYDDLFKVNDINGELVKTEEKLDIGSYMIAGHFSRKINKRIFAGINVKLVNEKIEDSTMGIGGDIGIIYKITENINTGLSGLNLGIKDAPMILRGGIGYSRDIGKRITGMISGEVENISDSGMKVGIGSEFTFLKVLSVRAGYRISDDLGQLRLGGGVLYKSLRMDYSNVSYKELGNVNRISLKMSI